LQPVFLIFNTIIGMLTLWAYSTHDMTNAYKFLVDRSEKDTWE